MFRDSMPNFNNFMLGYLFLGEKKLHDTDSYINILTHHCACICVHNFVQCKHYYILISGIDTSRSRDIYTLYLYIASSFQRKILNMAKSMPSVTADKSSMETFHVPGENWIHHRGRKLSICK